MGFRNPASLMPCRTVSVRPRDSNVLSEKELSFSSFSGVSGFSCVLICVPQIGCRLMVSYCFLSTYV